MIIIIILFALQVWKVLFSIPEFRIVQFVCYLPNKISPDEMLRCRQSIYIMIWIIHVLREYVSKTTEDDDEKHIGIRSCKNPIIGRRSYCAIWRFGKHDYIILLCQHSVVVIILLHSANGFGYKNIIVPIPSTVECF